MNFKESFQIKNGTEIYKEDLTKLEELLKEDDIPGVYGMKYTDEKYLEFTFYYVTSGIKSSYSFSSISDVPDEYEDIEIKSLYIEKRLLLGKEKQIITININRNFIDISILGNNINWLKTRKFLLEDFFQHQQSKSNKFNYIIVEKGDMFVSIVGGSLIGIGFSTGEHVFAATGLLLFAVSAIVTYPTIRRKYFPINKVMLQKKDKKQIEQKENKVKSFILNGLINVFWGVIASVITYFLLK